MNAPLSPATLSPLARYEQATAPDGWLTSPSWLRLAADLNYEADSIEDSVGSNLSRAAFARAIATKLRDHATDCRARASSMRAGAL